MDRWWSPPDDPIRKHRHSLPNSTQRHSVEETRNTRVSLLPWFVQCIDPTAAGRCSVAVFVLRQGIGVAMEHNPVQDGHEQHPGDQAKHPVPSFALQLVTEVRLIVAWRQVNFGDEFTAPRLLNPYGEVMDSTRVSRQRPRIAWGQPDGGKHGAQGRPCGGAKGAAAPGPQK
jgi:hypothetical protein